MSRLNPHHRLVIVTGKGGVGKSLLAAAVAKCSAAAGLATVLVTRNTHEARHPVLGVPLGYEPRETAHGFALCRVEPFQAATEYARRSLPFGGLYEAFFRSRTFRDFAAAVPGYEELMCLGRLYQLATESRFQRVVFDAPATGHLRELLGVPEATQRVVQVGPLNHTARRIQDLMLDPDRTRLVVATLPEELPVAETLEILSLARDLRIGLGPVLVNRRVARRFSEAEMAALEAVGGPGWSEPARNALAVAREELAESASERLALVPLEGARVRVVEIPRIVQRHYDGDALLRETARYLAPAVGGVMAGALTGLPAGGGSGSRGGGAARWTGGDWREGPTRRLDLSELVGRQRILVCCGSGGVGKTTTAAALGTLAARAGLTARVLTIDPARRLAQAMGLESLGHEPQRVPLEAAGELHAMMLDSRRALDRLVETYAPDTRVREAIFGNNYYRQLSSSLAGSRELAAMERVREVASLYPHDLLIVDTPPAQHAVDFLEAPARLISLLDGPMTQWLIRPYELAARAQFNLFRQSSAAATRFLERFTGVQALSGLSDFLLAFSTMFDGFRERAHQAQELMRDPGTGFLLICAPEATSLSQMDEFAARLARDGMNVAGVLANKVHPPPAGVSEGAPGARLEMSEQDVAALAGAGDPAFSDVPLPDRLAQTWQEAVDLYVADRSALAAAHRDALPLFLVPKLSRELHHAADLERLADLLAAPAPGGAASSGPS